jgi:hypothetical protein
MADILPLDRPQTWEPGVNVGVIGGIPSGSWTNIVDMTQAPYNCDPAGVADCQAAFDTALATEPWNTVLYFPAGEYRFSSGMNLAARYGGRVAVRGARMFLTKIKYEGAQGFVGGTDPGWDQLAFSPHGTVTPGDFALGATTIHVVSTGGQPFQSGLAVMFGLPNDWTVPITKYVNDDYIRNVFNYVTSAVNTGGDNWTLTLAGPLPVSQLSGTITVTQPQPGHTSKINFGIEDLTLEAVNHGQGLWFGTNTYNTWAKNVRLLNWGGKVGASSYRMGIKADQCFANEISGCFVGQANVPLIEMQDTRPIAFDTGSATSCLVYNNILVDNYAHFLAEGSFIGGALVYNFCKTGYPANYGVIGFSTSHIPHSQSCLFEGNILDIAQEDNYHGSASHNTWHRNWFLSVINPGGWVDGLPTTGTPSYSLATKRWSRQGVIAGNISGVPGVNVGSNFSIGYPNMGNGSWYGESSLIGTDGKSPWQDWDVSTGKPHMWRGVVLSKELDPERKLDSSYERGVVRITSGNLAVMDARIATAVALYTDTAHNAGFGMRWVVGSHPSHEAMGGYCNEALVNGNEIHLSSRFGTNFYFPEVGQEVWIYPSSFGFQELDRDCYATTKLRENKLSNGTHMLANEGPYDHPGVGLQAGETMRASYVFPGGAPAAMQGYAWPPFAPEVAIGTLSIGRIRAGQNYLDFLATGEFNTDDAPPTQVAMPLFSPAAGSYDTMQSVTMSCSTPGPGVEIRFTTNGDEPTAASTLYTSPIQVSSTTTLKAKAFKAGLTDSATRTGAYTIQVAQPTFTPAPGTFASSQNVTITTSTAGAIVHCTTDGSTPSAASPTYSAPVPITATTTLKAIAIKAGLDDSTIRSGLYTIETGTQEWDFPDSPVANVTTYQLANRGWKFNGTGWRSL